MRHFSSLTFLFLIAVICQGQTVAWSALTGLRTNKTVTDEQGNTYTTGELTETTDADPGPGVFMLTEGNSPYIYILKLDNDGNFLWATTAMASGIIYPTDIETDSNGNVFVFGTFSGKADFNPMNGGFLLGADDRDAFLMKLSPDGDLFWTKKLGGNNCDLSHAMSIGNNDIKVFFSRIKNAIVIVNKLAKSAVFVFWIVLVNNVYTMERFFLKLMIVRVIAIHFVAFVDQIN